MSTTTSSTTTTTTTQPPYAIDSDLLDRRPNILSLGKSEWDSSHSKAKILINRDLEAMWYRKASAEEGLDFRATPFAPSRMLDAGNQLKDLGVFKALELIYEYLAKDSEEDNYMKLRDRYYKTYRDELKSVIALGIDYDWDANGILDNDEVSYQAPTRRLQRV